MKYYIWSIFAFMLLTSGTTNSDKDEDDFKSGEYLKYKVHYGVIVAGYATLNISETTYNGQSHLHCVGKGWTEGMSKWFFKVDDTYETYLNSKTYLPSKFVRKVDEGGYKKDIIQLFNHSTKTVTYQDKIANTTKNIKWTQSRMDDMISAFYYLRNYDTSKLKDGDYISVNIFMDEEVYNFKLKLIGREYKSTKWGKVKCLKIRPYVQAGRIFEAKESVTMWVTDDNNKIPVEVKAELMVGSLKASLIQYSNIITPIKFVK